MKNRTLSGYLSRGGLIAYPTESCYGLGCDPLNYRAVLRLLRLKQRPQKKGLILIAGNYLQLARYIQPLTVEEQQLLKYNGRQTMSCLMPAKKDCPRWLRGAHDTLAVRITAHKDAAALCIATNLALVSTSANRSGAKPARTPSQCRRMFGATVKVLPGRVGKRKKPSTIVAWSDGKIIRK